MKNHTSLENINRILFGNSPPEFSYEVIVRCIIIYIALLVVVKLFGKRMAGQLTIVEIAIMIMLGAIVSVPMQVAERGLLMSLAALLCILSFQRFITWVTFIWPKADNLISGKCTLLIKDGEIIEEALKKKRISKEQLLACLREEEVFDLSKVKRLYFEACGQLSLYKAEDENKHKNIFPKKDKELIQDGIPAI
jgi:uncharacterized membrane protein YcaP (DUF421 family)